MHELFDSIQSWFTQGQPVVLATVISTWGSSPRRVGAKLAFTPGGGIAGSVSGGCIEGAVIEAGLAGLKGNLPQLLHFGVSDETAFTVGLACGGEIDLFIQELEEPLFHSIKESIEAGRPVALVTVLSTPPSPVGSPQPTKFVRPGDRILITEDEQILAGSPDTTWAQSSLPFAELALRTDSSVNIELPSPFGDPLRVFIDAILPPPALVIVGGGHVSVALTAIAKAAGYQTTLVDPRRAFANPERFPEVDQLLPSWPQEAFKSLPITPNTAIAVLTHDPKIDDPALKLALDSPAFYIGALGSRKTHAARLQRLRRLDLTDDQLAAIRGPIGLPIGAVTPEEIALAIMAEIVATRRNKV